MSDRRSGRGWDVSASGVVLLLMTGFAAIGPHGARAEAPHYTFTAIAVLGDPAPGGGRFVDHFEPMGLNDRGELEFDAGLDSGYDGMYVWRAGEFIEILRSGDPAPGGGTFEGSAIARVGLNESGDLAFNHSLSPFTLPLGMNAGLFRFSRHDGTLLDVLLPGAVMPGGGVLAGAAVEAGLNNRGDIVFAANVYGDDIEPGPPGVDGLGVGQGVYKVDKNGVLSTVARPGDSAPGGGLYDWVGAPAINTRGDIAFSGHLTTDEVFDFGQDLQIWVGESIYLRDAVTGQIRSIAHMGDPAPGGDSYRIALDPEINERGDVAFIAELTPPPDLFQRAGVFLYTRTGITVLARTGSQMPGGGRFTFLPPFLGTHDLNNSGDVAFFGLLDTDDNNDSVFDSGMWVSSRGSLRLIARTGTVIPGLGTVAHVSLSDILFFGWPRNMPNINNRGQVTLDVILEDGRVVLLLATPDGAPDKALPDQAVTFNARSVPNPAHGLSTFDYFLERSCEVRLSVLDVGGRIVRTLLEHPQAAGRRLASWDLRDDRGAQVPSGVYFYRLETAAGSRVEKIVVTR